MQHYIKQLLDDLSEAAKTPPALPYTEIPPHLEQHPDIAELALVPYKPISEWTGIDSNVFPEMYLLSMEQMEQVGKAMIRVLNSMGVEIVDLPDEIPPEHLYMVLAACWDEPVQYLPSTGYDLELCTGDPDTCPYGDLCGCGIQAENRDDQTDLPPFTDESDDQTGLPF